MISKSKGLLAMMADVACVLAGPAADLQEKAIEAVTELLRAAHKADGDERPGRPERAPGYSNAEWALILKGWDARSQAIHASGLRAALARYENTEAAAQPVGVLMVIASDAHCAEESRRRHYDEALTKSMRANSDATVAAVATLLDAASKVANRELPALTSDNAGLQYDILGLRAAIARCGEFVSKPAVGVLAVMESDAEQAKVARQRAGSPYITPAQESAEARAAVANLVEGAK